jgi:potassium efflux system protein
MRSWIQNNRIRDIFVVVSLLLLAVACPQALAADTPTGNATSSRQKLLDDEVVATSEAQAGLTTWRSQIDARISEFSSRAIDAVELDRARLAVETEKVALDSIALDIAAVKQELKEFANAIQDLEDQLQTLAAAPATLKDSEAMARAESALAEKQVLLKLEQRHLDLLMQRRSTAREHLNLTEGWWAALRDHYQAQQEGAQQQTLEALEQRLAEERNTWQSKAAENRAKIAQGTHDDSISQSQEDMLKVLVREADESVFLIDTKLRVARARAQLEKTDFSDDALQVFSPQRMEAFIEDLRRLGVGLEALEALLKSKADLLQQWLAVIEKRRDLTDVPVKENQRARLVLKSLTGRFSKQLDEVRNLRKTVQERQHQAQESYLERKRLGLTERHQLPRNIEKWRSLLVELAVLPTTALQMARNTALSLWTAMQQVSAAVWARLIPLALIWTIICLALGRLGRHKDFRSDHRFTTKAVLVSTSLLRANRFGLLIGGLLLLAGWMLDIVSPGLAVIGAYFGIWFGVRFTIGLSYWLLQSPIIRPDYRQPGLRRLIVGFALFVSLFSLALALGHLGFLSTELRELIDRAFMLFLLPPVYLALRIRKLLITMLKERKGATYWGGLLGLAGFAVPLAVLAAAILGISGYVNLAWSVAGHLAVFLGVVSVWLIARGLVIDLARATEEVFTRRSERGVLWMKTVVEPLHYLARLSLFLLVAWILYRLYGGGAPEVSLNLQAWLEHPLFTVGNAPIDVLDLLIALLLLVLVVYLGHWARHVTYSWVYTSIVDLGIRNSLSVFTQYAMVVVGLIIVLNTLGIDFTSLTVFAGALGVGIGFGLKNIADNFISGIILLAERPIRTNDWLTLDGNNGTVSRIGMRSVTLTTWDNQDVIIPNSNLISNAFTNWTRSDSLVRTVFVVGVRYQDDPHQAQTIISEAVTLQPEVSLDPPPQVWLSEFGASSVDFRVHYYVDIAQHVLLDIKSKVMFAIWDALKEANIGIPFPQQDIYIKELPTDKGTVHLQAATLQNNASALG